MDETEDALSRFARDYSKDGDAALLQTGTEGLRRLLGSFFGDERTSIDWPAGREGIDRFQHGLTLLARAHPEAFIEVVRKRPTSYWSQRVNVAATLGQIADPTTVDILCGYLGDEHWLVRLHSVRALDRLGGHDAQRGIEVALRDRKPTVRIVAMQAVSRWDAPRAMTLYEQALRAGRFVRSRALPSHIRREAEADLADLRVGRPIPPTRPWRLGPL